MNLFVGAIFTFALCTGISSAVQFYNQPLSRLMRGRIQDACPSAVNDSFCLNGGTSRAETIYKQTTCYCECSPEFFGERCEITKKSSSKPCGKEIQELLCLNGGTCVEANIAGQLIYYCDCPDRIWKDRCQTKSVASIQPCPADLEKSFCLNGGTCRLQMLEDEEYYFCECPTEYTGLHCQHDMLPEHACSPPFFYLLCLNGGTCSRLLWKYKLIYSCHCTEGYYGIRCENEVKNAGHDKCKNESFCLNGGTCYAIRWDSAHIYFCECQTGYKGHRCEVKLETYGDLCSLSVQETFCRNGGTCYKGNVTGVVMYYCQCRVGFWGARCEEQTILRLECPEQLQLNLCKNGGTCLAITFTGQDMIYFCKCPEGLGGIACEYSDKPLSTLSECPMPLSEKYCLNNGTCYKDVVLEIPGYFCVCPYPFYGERCELRFPSESNCPENIKNNLCTEDGICIEITLMNFVVYYCECKNGFYGIRCEHSFTSPAETGGSMACGSPWDIALCLHGGTCIQVITNQLSKLYFCICIPGFYGLSCEYPYPPPQETKCPSVIADSYCYNGGTCVMSVIYGLRMYYCRCPMNTHGNKCEVKSTEKFGLQDSPSSPCPHNIAKSYCQNGGTCYTELGTAGEPIYYCACDAPYFGERCEEKVYRRSLSLSVEVNGTCPPLLAATKCQNGGLCVTNVTEGETIPYCICPAPFYGEECEFSTLVSDYQLQHFLRPACPPEMNGYCLNGGTCYTTETVDHLMVYNCECPPPYHGEQCEFQLHRRSPKLPCPENVANYYCQNGGTCYMESAIGSHIFECVCPLPYIGRRCEQTVHRPRPTSDQCSPQNSNKFCNHGGKCLTLYFSGDVVYYCDCPYPFYGKTCELKYHESLSCPVGLRSSLCLNGGSCVVAEFNGHHIKWCQCSENFVGPRCEHMQSTTLFCPPPLNTELCKNGGSCISAVVSEGQEIFLCQCTGAFTGPSCEYLLLTVPSLPGPCPPAMEATFCLNGGKCQVEVITSDLIYLCKCPYPYHGERCEFKLTAASPCTQRIGSCLCCNSGKCYRIVLDDCDIFYCECPEGYYGARCEHSHETQLECPRPFSTELCKNAGTCVAIMTSGEQNIYFCKCIQGFYGMSCEYPYPALQSSCVLCPPYLKNSLCLNGGKCCMDSIVGHPNYYCVCPEPYYGKKCELKHYKGSSCSLLFRKMLCLNGGSCIQGKSNGYNMHWCECTEGYYGARCEHNKTVTTSEVLKCPPSLNNDLCKNGGTCMGIVSSAGRDLFFCECPKHFYGLSCENFHGPVASAVPCPQEETAPYCLHGGTCRFDAYQSLFFCICRYPYSGMRCEYADPELLSCPQSIEKYLCLNSGTCIYVRLTHYGFYFCKCSEGFYGRSCEYSYEDSRTFIINCPAPVDTELCKNGGICHGATVHDDVLYFCKCLENFYGLSCEYQYVHDANKGNECPLEIEQHFCEHGGTCYAEDIEGIHIYYCECLPPYFGGRCELINPKPQSCPWILDQFLCFNSGICTTLLSEGYHEYVIYYCECKEGYGGHRCENKIFPETETEYCSQPGSDWFCLNNGTCFQEVINGQSIYHCECKKKFFGDRCQIKVVDQQTNCSYGYSEIFCLHGGTCFEGSVGLVTMFYCECQDGYIGERCEFKQPRIRDCCPEYINKILCLNGGTCYKENIHQQDYFICACQGHYLGPRCEYKPASAQACPSDSGENFCLNGGTCFSFVFESITVYYCQCADGHYGARCEHAVNNTLVEGLCSADIAEWFCANGGTCFHVLVLNEPFYYCECKDQYTGARCEYQLPSHIVMCSVNITEVFCRLGSACYDMMQGSVTFHYCVCTEGYRGKRCQYEKYKHTCPSILATEFCLNGATCEVIFFKGHVVYYCECTTEYYGLRCEIGFPYSAGVAYPCQKIIGEHYCLNGGTCYETDQTGETVSFCECAAGYEGLRCEYSSRLPGGNTDCPSPLKESFCMNGGTCVMAPDNAAGNSFACLCMAGYQGLKCESRVNIDSSNKESNCYPPHNETFCLNGGTCYQDGEGTDAERRCECSADFYGPRCESSSALLAFLCPQDMVSDFCYNGGTCYQADHGPDTIYFCHCPDDYRGLRCEYGPDVIANETRLCPPPLDQGYCQNGGTCYQVDNGTNTFYFCECPPGFSGPRCEDRPEMSEVCDFPLDQTFCFNGGTCHQVTIPSGKVYYCWCTEHYWGLRCENPMPCAGAIVRRCDEEKEKDFCLNGGLCYESECQHRTTFACTCPEGYTGVRCEFSPARRQGCPYPYDIYFCQNGGLCVSLLFEGHAMYGCKCPQGYSGEKCEFDMSTKHDFCPVEFGEIFCLNRGICFETIVLNEIVYYCKCPDGYWGERCEFSGVLKHPCPKSLQDIFCQNSGECYMVIWAGSDIYYCQCVEGFCGTRCEEKVSTEGVNPLCLTEECQNGGTCYAKVTGGEMTYACECPGGSWGEKCENSYSALDSRKILANYSNMQYILNNSCCPMLKSYIRLSNFLLWIFFYLSDFYLNL